MIKILQIVDTDAWAINKLCAPVIEYNAHFDWKKRFIHPKALERGEVDLEPIRKDIEWCDMIDANYWRTLSQLAEMIPEIKDKKILLTHHNEKNVASENWDYVDHFIGATKNNEQKLIELYGESKVTYILNSFNHKEFEYNDDYPPKEPMVGYVGRIVPWKGLKQIVKVCHELGYKLLLMGKMDKRAYFEEIPEEQKKVIDWSFFECEDNERKDYYKNITCYLGYSGSGRETGPLGLIEAMACGVPVITTPSGIANDICEDMVNSLVLDFDDYDGLKHQLKNLMESQSLQNRLRVAGWNTVKNLNEEVRALRMRKVFNKMLYGDDLVSIIIPATFERMGRVEAILNSLKEQTYKNFEVILVWDEHMIGNASIHINYDFAIKQICTGRDEGYNLAMARNMGVIESDGKYIMFLDSRLKPNNDAIQAFVSNIKGLDKVWLFGNKGFKKQTFVENFSFILREEFIAAGMMNERITGYGGMSQELRERFLAQGFELKYCDDVKAEELMTARKNVERRNQIINMKNLLFKMYG